MQFDHNRAKGRLDGRKSTIIGDNAKYERFSKRTALQWSWCQCDGPPQDVAYCYLAAANPIALQFWKPDFIVGTPGDPCEFTFTYQAPRSTKARKSTHLTLTHRAARAGAFQT